MARIRVDLSVEPTATAVRERFDLLAGYADEMLQSGGLSTAEIFLDDAQLVRVVEGYYLMSEAYKEDRLRHTLQAPKLTEGSKKAALSALSIMTFRPFRRVDPLRPLLTETSWAANQLLAMTSAASFLGRDFGSLTWEHQKRLFRWLDAVGVGCLSEYIKDQAAGLYKTAYDVDVADEQSIIDAAILIFESPLK